MQEYIMAPSYWRKEYSQQIESAWGTRQEAKMLHSFSSSYKASQSQSQWLQRYNPKDDSLYHFLHRYIFTEWGISSQQKNLSTLKQVGKSHNMTLKEVIDIVNKNVYFRTQVCSKNQIKHWRSFQNFAIDVIQGKHDSVSNKGKDIWSKLTKSSRTFRTLSSYSGADQIELNYMSKEKDYNPQFNTTGFTQLEKTLHPITAPAIKELLIEDYLTMQKEAGIPVDDAEHPRKGLEQGGVKYMWHSYGLLAQHLERKSTNEIISHPLDYIKDFDMNTASEEYQKYLRSFLEDTQFGIFVCACRRLNSVTEDKNKIFTLLVHLYNEFANDDEWKEAVRKEMFTLEEDEYTPHDFAEFVMEEGNMYMSHSVILNELWECEMWDLLTEFDNPNEFITTHSGYTTDNETDYSSWDAFMKDRYFTRNYWDTNG